MPYEVLSNAQTLTSAQPASTAGRYETLPSELTLGQEVNNFVGYIPRALGLTARYLLEGPAQAAQIFTEPVAGLMRSAGVNTKSLGELATGAADLVGLPSPSNSRERVMGDAARLVAGTGGFASAAGAASKLPGMIGTLGEGLAANVASQGASAAGAGYLGGASREAGGDLIDQMSASFLGGIGGGVGFGAANALGGMAKRALTPNLTTPELNLKISTILANQGQDFSALPAAAQASLRADLASALNTRQQVNPDAVSRLAAFKAVGATPTQGMVSQNPIQITKEMNLAKIAANASDTELSGLPMMQNQNNATLLRNLNDLGGSSNSLPIEAGSYVNNKILATQSGLRAGEKSAWDAAKSSPGYTQPIYPDGLNAANAALGESGMMAFMSEPISKYMASFQSGAQPFTPQAYRNLQSMLSNEMKPGSNGNSAAAARTARDALEATPMKPITNAAGIDLGQAPLTSDMASRLRNYDAQAGNSIAMVDTARSATKAAYDYEKSSALVKAALAGGRSSDPENIAKSFVLGGTLNDAQSVLKEVGTEGIPAIRNALASYIKNNALSGAADEVGKVSQSRLNSTLKSIGDQKLALFFNPEELAQLKATGRVASLMQSQPIGSAVNNSNSGALMVGKAYDALRGGLSMVTGVGPVAAGLMDLTLGNPTKNAANFLSNRQAANYIPGLLSPEVATQSAISSPYILPGFAVSGGILGSDSKGNTVPRVKVRGLLSQ